MLQPKKISTSDNASLAKHAFSKTRSTLVGRWRTVIYSVISVGIGSALYYHRQKSSGSVSPLGDAMNEILTWTFYVAFPFLLFAIGTFVFNYWKAPYQILESKIDEMRRDVSFLNGSYEQAIETSENLRKEVCKLSSKLDKMDKDLASRLQETATELNRQLRTLEETIPRTRILEYPPFQDHVTFNDYLLGHIQTIVSNMVNPVHARLLPIENDLHEMKEAVKNGKEQGTL